MSDCSVILEFGPQAAEYFRHHATAIALVIKTASNSSAFGAMDNAQAFEIRPEHLAAVVMDIVTQHGGGTVRIEGVKE